MCLYEGCDFGVYSEIEGSLAFCALMCFCVLFCVLCVLGVVCIWSVSCLLGCCLSAWRMMFVKMVFAVRMSGGG